MANRCISERPCALGGVSVHTGCARDFPEDGNRLAESATYAPSWKAGRCTSHMLPSTPIGSPAGSIHRDILSASVLRRIRASAMVLWGGAPDGAALPCRNVSGTIGRPPRRSHSHDVWRRTAHQSVPAAAVSPPTPTAQREREKLANQSLFGAANNFQQHDVRNTPTEIRVSARQHIHKLRGEHNSPQGVVLGGGALLRWGLLGSLRPPRPHLSGPFPSFLFEIVSPLGKKTPIL